MNDVRQWLASLGLERFADLFEREQITLDNLREITGADLRELGVPLGPRKTILSAAASLPQKSTSGPAQQVRREPSPTPEQPERRQLTVLFCDMVGFTELANRIDPEVLQGIIRSYEDACAVCITRYEGYVFQRLGDGIVAFFGYPLAHEGEAERATWLIGAAW